MKKPQNIFWSADFDYSDDINVIDINSDKIDKKPKNPKQVQDSQDLDEEPKNDEKEVFNINENNSI